MYVRGPEAHATEVNVPRAPKLECPQMREQNRPGQLGGNCSSRQELNVGQGQRSPVPRTFYIVTTVPCCTSWDWVRCEMGYESSLGSFKTQLHSFTDSPKIQI